MEFVKKNPDKVSSDTLRKINEEFKFYEENLSNFSINKSKLKLVLDDKKRNVAIWSDPNIKSGHMSIHFAIKKFKMAEFG